jgi:hypothetical protein
LNHYPYNITLYLIYINLSSTRQDPEYNIKKRKIE